MTLTPEQHYAAALLECRRDHGDLGGVPCRDCVISALRAAEREARRAEREDMIASIKHLYRDGTAKSAAEIEAVIRALAEEG